MPTFRRFDKSFLTCGATALLSVAVAAGCAKKPPEPTDTANATGSVQTTAQPPAASSGAAMSAATPPPAGSGPSPSTAMAPDDQSLASQIAYEARNRKPGNPSVEQVFALCEKLGAPVPTKEQTIGKTYRAAYCVGGFTADKHVTINVCEYPTEASVAEGVAISTTKFKTLADRRQVLSRRATTLTLFEAEPSAESKALVKKLGDAFLAM